MDIESEQGRNRFELRGNEFNPRLSVDKISEPPMHFVLLVVLVFVLVAQVGVYNKLESLSAITMEHSRGAESRWADVEREIKANCTDTGSQIIRNSNVVGDKLISHIDLVCK